MKTLAIAYKLACSNVVLPTLILGLLVAAGNTLSDDRLFTADKMIIRISAIQIDPNYLDEYMAILKEEAAASVSRSK